MNQSEILTAIDEEISRLQQVRDLLDSNLRSTRKAGGTRIGSSTAFAFGSNGTAPRRKRRKMSAAGRARIAAAQRARWAKLKKAAADKK